MDIIRLCRSVVRYAHNPCPNNTPQLYGIFQRPPHPKKGATTKHHPCNHHHGTIRALCGSGVDFLVVCRIFTPCTPVRHYSSTSICFVPSITRTQANTFLIVHFVMGRTTFSAVLVSAVRLVTRSNATIFLVLASRPCKG